MSMQQRNISIIGSSCVSNTAAELTELLALDVTQLDKTQTPAALRRRTSLTTLLAIHAAFSACHRAEVDPQFLSTLFCSIGGEVQVTDKICVDLTRETIYVSPTQFHSSVHNTSAAYWSIVTGNQQPNTALGAGQQTVAMALLEAWVRLQIEGGQLLVVCYEESWPEYLEQGMGEHSVALALVLSADEPDDRAGAVRISCPQAMNDAATNLNKHWPISADLAALIRSVPVLALAPLLQALQSTSRNKQHVSLDGVPGSWVLELEPHG